MAHWRVSGCIEYELVVSWSDDGPPQGVWREMEVDQVVVAGSPDEAAERARGMAMREFLTFSNYWLYGPDVERMPADYEARACMMQPVLFGLAEAGDGSPVVPQGRGGRFGA